MDGLLEHWTILDEERELIAGKRGATRLAFGILLKFYTRHSRFPRGRSELPDEAIEHVAKQVKVHASELGLGFSSFASWLRGCASCGVRVRSSGSRPADYGSALTAGTPRMASSPNLETLSVRATFLTLRA
ncbi:DUF4158 domain-containing protein [Streptosporangium sp. NPDC023825]|uniref:DUF4158 domain-containing protein n=1 Tax=Streptosporangium sp. NPDC023825 TaxID=3154909 RepID=UPI00344A2B70